MKSALILAALLAPTPAFAEALFCNFTEPFIDLQFDGNSGQILKSGPENFNPETKTFETEFVGMGAIVAGDGYRTFRLAKRDGTTVLDLTLDLEGSDGMSDTIYPFTAVYEGVTGACYTNTAPPWNPDRIGEALMAGSN